MAAYCTQMTKMKKALITSPGILTLMGWMGLLVGWVLVRTEVIPEEDVRYASMAMLFVFPLVQVIALAGGVIAMLAGHKGQWPEIGMWGGLVGLAFSALIWFALASAFSDLASFG